MKRLHFQKGDSVLELLLAIALFSLVIPTLLYVVGSTADRQGQRNFYFESLVKLEEAREVVRTFKTKNWDSVSTPGLYELVRPGGVWQLQTVAVMRNPTITEDFVITVAVANVSRNAQGALSSDGSGYVDPATKKITITVDWYGAATPTQSALYITRTDALTEASFALESELNQTGVQFDGTRIIPASGESLAYVTVNGDAPGPLLGAMSFWNMNGEKSALRTEIDLAEGGVDNLFFAGTPTFASARFTQALDINALTTRLYASPSARLDLTGQMTLSFWIKTNQSPLTYEQIVDKFDTERGYEVRLNASGILEGRVGNGTSSLLTQSANSVIDGSWHHIALVYDGNTLSFYQDGVQSGTPTSGSNFLFPSTSILSIGNDNMIPSHPFSGAVDEVQFYANALTQAEVLRLVYSTYTSPVVDLGGSRMVYALTGLFNAPPATKVSAQVSVTAKSGQDCALVAPQFTGPTGADTYFDVLYPTGQSGDQSFSLSVPLSSDLSSYLNPGTCAAFKLYFYSTNLSADEDAQPRVSDVQFLYAQ